MFQIPAVRGTENSRNSVPNHSEEEKKSKKEASSRIWFRIILRKRKQLVVPFRGTKIEANFRNFVTKHSAEEFCVSYFGYFIKHFFSRYSVPLRALEPTLPWTSEYLGMYTFFLGITETVPSLQYFPEFFQNAIPYPILRTLRPK